MSLSHVTELWCRSGINHVSSCGESFVLSRVTCHWVQAYRTLIREVGDWGFICFYISFVYLNDCIPSTSYLSHFQALKKLVQHIHFILQKGVTAQIFTGLATFCLFMAFHKADWELLE